MPGQGIGHWSVGVEKQLKGCEKGRNGSRKVILQMVLRMAEPGGKLNDGAQLGSERGG